jgi:hypothetical protein
MKVGDLVRMKGDDVLGLIMKINRSAEASFGRSWYVFYFDYCGTPLSMPALETELVVINECR